nr:hypothetical protein [Acidobacteriota bacterium]
MKRLSITAFATAVLLGVLTTSATAAKSPTPGAACSPAGLTRKVTSVTFTCVKKGKKSVWSAGASGSTAGGTGSTTTTTIPADSVDYKGV